MKVAITATENSLEGQLDPRFGRARYFLVYDLENDRSEFIDNHQNLNAPQGAGVQSAQTVLDQQVGAVVSSNLGPRAHAILSQAGVKIFQSEERPLKDIVEDLKNDRLNKITGANVPGHW